MAVAKPTDSIVFFSLPLFAPEGDGNTALHRSIERKNRRSRARRRQPKNPQQRGAAERRENAAINSLPNGPQRDSNQQFHVPQMQFVVAKAVFFTSCRVFRLFQHSPSTLIAANARNICHELLSVARTINEVPCHFDVLCNVADDQHRE